MTVVVHEVMEQSRNDPDKGPRKPPAKGMWVWWRTGPHPQGVWQAMDLNTSTKDGKETYDAWQKNQEEFPIFQDQAFGNYGDFGNFTCHSCDYFSDGYPEPNHMTICDGICKRARCDLHGAGGKAKARKELKAAVDWARSRGIDEEEMRKFLAS